MANLPSIKTLTQIFDDNAKEARKVLEFTQPSQCEAYPAAQARIRECYHPPKLGDLKRTILNQLGDFYGQETVQFANGSTAYYLNAGDTYTPTLIYFEGNYRVQDIGSLIEAQERRHNRAISH